MTKITYPFPPTTIDAYNVWFSKRVQEALKNYALKKPPYDLADEAALYDLTLKQPDGGPSDYYDLPLNSTTLNDLLEHKGDKHWLGDAFHLSNIVKAAWRWGIKSGTDKAYDARKFVYSGIRLLLKYRGQQEVRRYLQELLNDPQFGGEPVGRT